MYYIIEEKAVDDTQWNYCITVNASRDGAKAHFFRYVKNRVDSSRMVFRLVEVKQVITEIHRVSQPTENVNRCIQLSSL